MADNQLHHLGGISGNDVGSPDHTQFIPIEIVDRPLGWTSNTCTAC